MIQVAAAAELQKVYPDSTLVRRSTRASAHKQVPRD